MERWNEGLLECPTYYRASLKSFVIIAERTSTARRTEIKYYYSAYNVSGSYIGGTLVLLRTTIGIICWTEMVTISIVDVWIILSVYMYIISCAWHTALRSYTTVDGVSL